MADTGVYLLSVDALDENDSPAVLRWASGEYIEDGHYWMPRINQPGLYTEGLFAGNILNVKRSGYGETTLINTDGALNYLVNCAMDGRDAVLRYVGENGITTLLTGTVGRVSFSDTEVSVRLRDPIEPFNNNHPSSKYEGDNVLPNGLEGTEDDLAGNVKPRVYGSIKNASPPLVNTAKLIYQVSDQDCTVSAVYDNGVLLEFDGDYSSEAELLGTPPNSGSWQDWEPPAGKWRRYKGYFRLGDRPFGQITCDASSPNTKVGDVCDQVLSEAGSSLTNGKSVLNQQGTLGILVNSERSTTSILDEILTSVGGWYRVTSLGSVVAGILEPPKASPDSMIESFNILSIKRESAGAGGNGIPIHSVELSCDHVETTQDDLAGDVSDDRRSRLSQAHRKVTEDSPAVLSRHPLSETLEITSRLTERSDGQATASRVLDLVSVRRDSVSLECVANRANHISIGDTIKVVSDRLGYEDGRNFLVVGKTFDQRKKKLTLNLWG